MRRVSSRLVLFAVLAIGALGFAAVGAVAKAPVHPKSKTIVITGGTTTVTASTATVKFLVSHGVTVTAVAPATMSATSITLPVRGGVVKPRSLDGALFHRGAVKFATATKSVTLRHLTLYKLGKKAHLAGVVDGKGLNLGMISGLKAVLNGKTATVTGEIHITRAVAKVINRLVGKHVVSAGYVLGSFSSTLTVK
jgi:hypothetical protein